MLLPKPWPIDLRCNTVSCSDGGWVCECAFAGDMIEIPACIAKVCQSFVFKLNPKFPFTVPVLEEPCGDGFGCRDVNFESEVAVGYDTFAV